MKKYLTLIAAIVFFQAAEAAAFEQHDVTFSGIAGQFGALEDVGFRYEGQIGAAAQVGFFLEDFVSLNLGGLYTNFLSREGAGSAQYAAAYIFPEFVFTVFDFFAPSISVGAGFYSTKIMVPKITSESVPQKEDVESALFGLNAGAAARFLIGNYFFLGLNGRYHLIFPREVKASKRVKSITSGEEYFDLGSDLYMVGIEAGFKF